MKRKNSRQPRRGAKQFNRSLIFRPRPPCPLKSAGIKEVDYKDLKMISHYVGDEWKIFPGRMNNLSASMQRQVKTAVKRARFLALLPYTPHHSLISSPRSREQ